MSRRFFLALSLIALGCGAFKPNISIQVGELYTPEDARRDRAYSIFYLGINIGAFLAPLVCGTLGETVDWRYGFAAAGVGMAIGLSTYLAGLSKLPPDRPQRLEDVAPAGSATDLRSAILSLSLLYLPSALFWAAFEQQGNTIALFAQNLTDRSVGFLSWRAEIPVTWFQAFNPLMIILFTPMLVEWWARRAAMGDRAFDAAQAFDRLPRPCCELSHFGLRRRRDGAGQGELALALCLFRRHHAVGTALLADHAVLRLAHRASGIARIVDGLLVHLDVCGQHARGVDRWLLVETHERAVFSFSFDARLHRSRDRRGRARTAAKNRSRLRRSGRFVSAASAQR